MAFNIHQFVSWLAQKNMSRNVENFDEIKNLLNAIFEFTSLYQKKKKKKINVSKRFQLDLMFAFCISTPENSHYSWQFLRWNVLHLSQFNLKCYFFLKAVTWKIIELFCRKFNCFVFIAHFPFPCIYFFL